MTGSAKLNQIAITTAIGLWAFANPMGASAQSRYSNDGWQAPPSRQSDSVSNYQAPDRHRSDARMRKLLKELRGLIREARQARAANPRFLGDLRKLARRYDRPRRKRILFDNFSDGNLSHNPTWRATGHGIHVSSRNGLRMRHDPYRTQKTQQNSRQSSRDALIGSLLGQLTGQPAQQQPQHRQIRSKPPGIGLAVDIPNAFLIELAFGSASGDGGRFVVGVTQGNHRLGYRLAYNPRSNQPIELIRRGRRGSAIIDATHGRLKLEDGNLHKLQLARDRHGEMTVWVDGKVLIRTVDTAFRGKFDGIMLINRGGDYTIRSIRIDGDRS